MFDVVVIGGNLAGATAAINAATKGVSVSLVERNKEPFFPAHCGEAITDIMAELLNLDKIGCAKNEIKNIIVNISSKEYAFKLKKHRIIIFDRNFVEKELLKEAEKKGVKLILGTSMRDFNLPHEIFLDNNTMIKGRVIIDASGIACQVGRRIGMDTRLRSEDIGVCIQSRVQGNFNVNMMKLWFHKPYAPFGYAWLFPFNEKMANIGLGAIGRKKLDFPKLLDNYIEDVTDGQYKITSTFRACVPLASPMSKLIKDNVMIVGDAARLAHPALGGGIGNALFSGSLAGIVAAKYIKGEIPSLKSYQNSMHIKISRLRKAYNSKVKVSETEEKFVRTYRRVFSILCFINKLFPNLLQGHISKILEQDKFILESYTQSPFIF
jgi:digeranylgeranylglycerophospholipid reductase